MHIRSFQHTGTELRVFGGDDSLQWLARELERAGARRALIVCGRSMAAGQGLSMVRDALADRCAGVFQGVQPDSPLPDVQRAAQALSDCQADAVIALGGGSAIVTARAASILLAEGSDAHGLCTRRGADGRIISPRLPAPKLPQFTVATTPTTALAKAGSAILDPASGKRLALFDPKTRARAIFVDPWMACSAPQTMVRGASLNTLTMAIEGLESIKGSALSDAALMHAVRLVADGLPLLDDAARQAQVRVDLILAAILCGQGTDQTGVGLATAFGHLLGARMDIDNGIVNALMLPHTMRFNAPALDDRQGKVLRALERHADPAPGGVSAAAIAAVSALLSRLQVPARLRDVGASREDFARIAEDALDDWFVQTNPRRIESSADVLGVMQAAW
ncbi:MAG: iron-containing alcohol dehydrogenase family protein [Burkholderiaceae bacterium]|nr:iron-containing alcohol dehydrogenase family protein [Burkholderiaceae bacterium]